METLGTKLKSAREKMNISLEKASEITQIRTHILDAFEKGNFSILPTAYAKSFVINYAKMLKIDISEIKDELEELFPSYKQPTIPKKEETAKGKKSRRIYQELNLNDRTKIVSLIIYFVIFIAVALMIYMTFFDRETVLIEENTLTDTVEDTAVVTDDEDNLFSFYAESDSLILEAFATDSAWMKINIDGVKSEQVYFFPNYSRRWSAANYFLLTLGNAGAIKFKRNGEDLPPLGPVGTVVRNVKITESEVINSSKPWNPTKKRRKIKKDDKEVPKIEPIQIQEDEQKLLKKLKEFKKPEPLVKPNNNKIKPIVPKEKKEESTPPN